MIPHALTSEELTELELKFRNTGEVRFDRDDFVRLLNQARAAIQLPDELVKLRAEVNVLRSRLEQSEAADAITRGEHLNNKQES
jgi:hypothetical protein